MTLCTLYPFFFHRGPNPFSAALDPVAISYSPFESFLPCFEKPGSRLFGPDLLIANANWLTL
jgi:hypothetical protein